MAPRIWYLILNNQTSLANRCRQRRTLSASQVMAINEVEEEQEMVSVRLQKRR
jgi:hypothetical protein